MHPILLILQALLSAVIIGALYAIYRQVKIEEMRERLRFLISAFIALIFSMISHAMSSESFFPSLLLEHVFGTIFFLLLGATGLLHFMEREHIPVITAFTSALVGFVLFATFGFLIYLAAAGIEFSMSTGHIVFAHLVQIGTVLIVTLFILRRILTTHTPLSLAVLYRRYPFGIAAALMAFAVVAHTLTMIASPGFSHKMSFFESLFALPALFIVAGYILFTYRRHIRFFEVGHVESYECNCFYCISERSEERKVRSLGGSLNHTIRQVYYTPVDIGIGGREVLFSRFLERTGLEDVFNRGEMELDEKEFFSALTHESLAKLSLGMLKFFVEHKELINEAQFYYLVNFFSSVHTYSRDDGFQQKWVLLSELAKALGAKGEEHIDTLSDWGRSSTFSYFEDVHPTGVQTIDEKFGGAKTHQCVLSITKEISSFKILYPVIKTCLHSWRNVIYVASKPAARIKKELASEEVYFQENRLKVISQLSSEEEGRSDGIYTVPSPQELDTAIKACFDEFPLCSAFLVLELTPVTISEDHKTLHRILTALSELTYSRRVVVFAVVSYNADSLAIDLLREWADIILTQKVIKEHLVTDILKPKVEKVALEKELFDILLYIYRQNSAGIKPGIGDISSAMGVDRRTVKKRLSPLEEKKMVKLRKWGRYKVAKVTPQGKELVLLHGT